MNEATKAPPKLRSKGPFHCHHQNAAKKFDHLEYALAESDTDLCPLHEAERQTGKTEAQLAWKRFLDKPVFPKSDKPYEPWTRGPIWPQ